MTDDEITKASAANEKIPADLESQAFERIHAKAKQDDAEGLYQLGACYENGIAVQTDMPKAMECYRKSAEKDCADAQYALAQIYDNRDPNLLAMNYPPTDPKESIRWLRKAAKNGHEKAKKDLPGAELQYKQHEEADKILLKASPLRWMGVDDELLGVSDGIDGNDFIFARITDLKKNGALLKIKEGVAEDFEDNMSETIVPSVENAKEIAENQRKSLLLEGGELTWTEDKEGIIRGCGSYTGVNYAEITKAADGCVLEIEEEDLHAKMPNVEKAQNASKFLFATQVLFDHIDLNDKDMATVIMSRGSFYERATPLHKAQNIGQAKFLLDNGADVNARTTEHGDTPLHTMKLDQKTLSLMLSGGADAKARNKHNETILHHQIQDGAFEPRFDEATMKEILSLGVEVRVHSKRNGRTPLHEAARYDKDGNLIKMLLREGSNLNIQDFEGRTPLHCAVYTENATEEAKSPEFKAVGALLEYGAYPNSKDKMGHTPLHDAAACENTEAMAQLLSFGADPEAKSENGYKPKDYVSNPKIAEMLDKAKRDIMEKTPASQPANTMERTASETRRKSI